MKLSPIGAFGGMAFTIGKFGFATLFVLGKLMAVFLYHRTAFYFCRAQWRLPFLWL